MNNKSVLPINTNLGNDFVIVKLGDVANIEKGQSITKSKAKPGNIPVIAGGQKPAYFHNEANRVGITITVSASGAYAGFVNFFDIPIFASDCSTITAKDKKQLNDFFLYYFLKSMQTKIYELAKGAAQPHVYPHDLINIEIPLPSIDLQNIIVKNLDVMGRKIKIIEQILINKEDTLKAVQCLLFNSHTSPNAQKLENITRKIKKISKDSKVEKIRYIEISDIKYKEEIPLKPMIALADAPANAKQILKENDTIVSKVRTYLKAITYVREIDTKDLIASGAFAVLRANEDIITPKYLYWSVQTQHFFKEVRKMSTGSTYPTISTKDLLQIKISMPSIQEQERIVEILDALQDEIDTLKKLTENYKEQQKSLMKKLLSGE